VVAELIGNPADVAAPALELKRMEMDHAAAAGLPPASVLITGEDVQNGQPFPDPYVLAAERVQVTLVAADLSGVRFDGHELRIDASTILDG
jgi:hypothetical protein